MVGAVESASQGCQHGFHVSFEQRSRVEPKAGKHAALEQPVWRRADLLVLRLPKFPPDNALFACNPCQVFANPVAAVSAFFLVEIIRVRAADNFHGQLGTWLGVYAAETRGVGCFDNSTVRLDLDNEPQPDLVLMKLPDNGGQARISADDYIEGAPELAVEIVGSSYAYDLHQKKGAYRRNGIREYLAWITGERRVVWWELREAEYQEIALAPDGLLKSGVFPGLWLDTGALLRGDMKTVLAALRRGLDSADHATFVAG